MTARYLVNAKVHTRSQRGDRMQAWAKTTLRDISRTTRRMAKLYDFHLDDNDEVYSVRRALKHSNKKKKKKYDPKPQFKYGVQVPRNIKQAMEFDKTNGNTLWQDSIKEEIKALTDLEYNNNFYLYPATVCVYSRNPIGTAVTVFIVGNLVRGENLQWRKPLACGGLCYVGS
jgi:hypothetical protein